MDEPEPTAGVHLKATQPLCLRCGQNPKEKSMCWECSGNGIFTIDPSVPRPCATCNNEPWRLRTGENTCPECGKKRPVYIPRDSERYRDEYVNCLLCHGSRFLEVQPGECYDCPECRTEGKMLPMDNQRVLDFLFHEFLQIAPSDAITGDETTLPRIQGLTMISALQKWPYGIVNETSRFFRYYVEPHISAQSGKLCDDTKNIPELRRYDVWTQSKHTPIGKAEREPRLQSCRLADVQNTLGYAFGCTAKDVLIPADWRNAGRGGAS